MLKKLSFLLLLGCVPLWADLTFTSDIFNHLDARELKSKAHELAVQSTSGALLDTLMLSFFLSERESLMRHPHEAKRLLKQVEDFCEVQGETEFKNFQGQAKARASYLCVLSELGFGGNSEKGALSVLTTSGKLRSWLQLASQSDFSFEERAYAEGRIYFLLPADLGRNFGKSLIALQSLKRLKPNLTSIDFFIGQAYQLKGNQELATMGFESALKNEDPRALLVFKKAEREAIEGQSQDDFRLYYGIVASPSGGVGAKVGMMDERLRDRARSLGAYLYGQSRGVGGLGLDYSDKETLKGLSLEGRLSVDYLIDQFYGFGIGSSLSNLGEIKQSESSSYLGISKPLEDFFITGGWRFSYRHGDSFSPGALPFANIVYQNSAVSGFEFGLGYDTQKPLGNIRKGSLIRLSVWLAQNGILSSASFSEYHFSGSHFFPIARAGRLKLQLDTSSVSAGAPFAVYRELSGTPRLPGVRSGRFRERAAVSALAELDFPLWGSIEGALFGTTGTVGPEWSELLSNQIKTGGGAALLFGGHRFFSRLEVGTFGGESVIQASVGLGAQ